jgi:hypothetical protein
MPRIEGIADTWDGKLEEFVLICATMGLDSLEVQGDLSGEDFDVLTITDHYARWLSDCRVEDA